MSLPQSIGALDKLMKLKCKMNQLRQVPHSIGELRNLQLLELDQAPSVRAHERYSVAVAQRSRRGRT